MTKKDHDLNYAVYDRDGVCKMRAPESCRHTKEQELSILDAKYTIKLNGKKVTRKEVMERE